MPGTFFSPPWVSDSDMHHGTCVTHVPWCMPEWLTSGFLWNRWRGKRSRHSRRMRKRHFYVSGKRPWTPSSFHEEGSQSLASSRFMVIIKMLLYSSRYSLFSQNSSARRVEDNSNMIRKVLSWDSSSRINKVTVTAQVYGFMVTHSVAANNVNIRPLVYRKYLRPSH